jgi:hypothetical protein
LIGPEDESDFLRISGDGLRQLPPAISIAGTLPVTAINVVTNNLVIFDIKYVK